jgi:hypothetical protein
MAGNNLPFFGGKLCRVNNVVKRYGLLGFAFYWGVYLLFSLLELVPGVLYSFGYVNYDFSDWAYQQIVDWVWFPAEIIITNMLFWKLPVILFVNTIFWIAVWIAIGMGLKMYKRSGRYFVKK